MTAVSFLNPSAFTVGGLINGVASHHESLLSWDVQIGSLKSPESPATTSPEIFSLLRRATAIHDESTRTINITPQSYVSNGFCIGCPLSAVPGASFASLNAKAGDILSIRAKGLAADSSINGAGRCYVTPSPGQIMEFREGSVSVPD